MARHSPDAANQAPAPAAATAMSAALANANTAAGNPGSAQMQAQLAREPLLFVPNVGQTAPSVSYIAKGPDYTFFLSGTSAVFALPLTGSAAAGGSAEEVLRLDFVGGNASAGAEGQGLQPSITNYVVNGDAAASHAKVPNYSSVVVRNIYPGIDVEFYGSGSGSLEYTFVVHPGADPSAIQLRWSGANGLSLDPQGNLDLSTAGGTIVDKAAVAYQGDTGGGRQVVSVSREIAANGTVVFRPGRYDATKDLIIDPTVSDSSLLGGAVGTKASGEVLDSSGDVYIVGSTTDTFFPTTTGVVDPVMDPGPDSNDAFITEFNPTDSGLMFSTFYGDPPSGGFVSVAAVALDSSANIYVCGTDAITNNGVVMDQAFVAKFNPGATAQIYATPTLATDLVSRYNAIAIDSNGQAFVTGTMTTLGNFLQHQVLLNSSLIVAKLDANGSFVFQETLATLANRQQNQLPGQVGNGIALDAYDNIYLTGEATADLTTTAGAFQPTYGGDGANAFVMELNSSGSQVWCTWLGGDGDNGLGVDSANAIVRDSSGDLFVTGVTYSKNFPVTTGAYQTTLAAPLHGSDAFLSELNATGTVLLKSTYLGATTGNSAAQALTLDSSGDVYIAGYTAASTFPTEFPVQSSLGGINATNAFVTEIDPTFMYLNFSTFYGGSVTQSNTASVDEATDIALDASGNVVIAGWTSSINFPTTVGAYDTSYGLPGTSADAFVTKINLT
jgi:hypothetical protein